MICPKCKKTLKDGSKFCGYCGKKFNTPPKPAVPAPVAKPTLTPAATVKTDENVAKCPKCGSTSLQASTKGVSVGKAVTGALLVGPLGLAAGAIGMNDTRVVCLNCGNKFTPNE